MDTMISFASAAAPQPDLDGDERAKILSSSASDEVMTVTDNQNSDGDGVVLGDNSSSREKDITVMATGQSSEDPSITAGEIPSDTTTTTTTTTTDTTTMGVVDAMDSSTSTAAAASAAAEISDSQHEFADDNEDSESSKSSERARTFPCDFPGCNKVFHKSCNFVQHIRVHTGERPFVCDEPGCGRSFAQSGNLTKHKKSHRMQHLRWNRHTRDKPFKCNFPRCLKSFTAKSSLQVHWKTHVQNEQWTPEELQEYMRVCKKVDESSKARSAFQTVNGEHVQEQKKQQPIQAGEYTGDRVVSYANLALPPPTQQHQQHQQPVPIRGTGLIHQSQGSGETQGGIYNGDRAVSFANLALPAPPPMQQHQQHQQPIPIRGTGLIHRSQGSGGTLQFICPHPKCGMRANSISELQQHIDKYTPGMAEVRLQCSSLLNTIQTLQRAAQLNPDMRLADALMSVYAPPLDSATNQIRQPLAMRGLDTSMDGSTDSLRGGGYVPSASLAASSIGRDSVPAFNFMQPQHSQQYLLLQQQARMQQGSLDVSRGSAVSVSSAGYLSDNNRGSLSSIDVSRNSAALDCSRGSALDVSRGATSLDVSRNSSGYETEHLSNTHADHLYAAQVPRTGPLSNYREMDSSTSSIVSAYTKDLDGSTGSTGVTAGVLNAQLNFQRQRVGATYQQGFQLNNSNAISNQHALHSQMQQESQRQQLSTSLPGAAGAFPFRSAGQPIEQPRWQPHHQQQQQQQQQQQHPVYGALNLAALSNASVSMVSESASGDMQKSMSETPLYAGMDGAGMDGSRKRIRSEEQNETTPSESNNANELDSIIVEAIDTLDW